MKQALFIALFLFSLTASAQLDDGNSGFSIPPANLPPSIVSPPSNPTTKAPSIFDPVPDRSSRSIPEKSNFKFLQTNEFINRGDEYVEKLNTNAGGDGGDYTAFRKNQYLGDYRTTSGTVTISYRDHQAVDGDEVRIWVNDRVVKTRIYLNGRLQGFDLELQPGFNKIDFEALNQGSSGPNTAEFRVVDDTGAVISANRWDLATGFKATMIIVKE